VKQPEDDGQTDHYEDDADAGPGNLHAGHFHVDAALTTAADAENNPSDTARMSPDLFCDGAFARASSSLHRASSGKKMTGTNRAKAGNTKHGTRSALLIWV
jgi:hypothetical protein